MPARLITSVAMLALVAGAALAEPAASPPGQTAAPATTSAPVRPAGQRISGVVKSVAATALVLTTADKGDVDLIVTADTRVPSRSAAAASEIAAGSYLGTTNVTAGAEGRATEVHLMDNGPNVHYAMNPANGTMMTNGHVTSVQTTANGEEMDVDYGSGVRHVVVPADTPVTRMTPEPVTSLTVGQMVTANATTGADGKLTATYILLAPPPAPAKP